MTQSIYLNFLILLPCIICFRISRVGQSSIRTTLFASSNYDYDVIIVGCGVGGHGAALHARANGLKTAVFTGGDVGGTCVNRGCVPSKALLAAAGLNLVINYVLRIVYH